MIGVTIIILTIDKVILDKITDKTLNRHLETEVKVEIEMEITTMTIREVEVEIEIMIGLFSQDKSTLSHGRDESRSRSNSRVSTNCDHVRCYRCMEYDHFASECPNTLTDEEPNCDNADRASLQMMTQDYYPIDSEGEIEYLNL